MKLHIDEVGTTRAYKYERMPKAKYAEGTATIDGNEVKVKVTGVGQTRFAQYSYFMLDGEVWYTKGNLFGTTVETDPGTEMKPGTGFDLID